MADGERDKLNALAASHSDLGSGGHCMLAIHWTRPCSQRRHRMDRRRRDDATARCRHR